MKKAQKAKKVTRLPKMSSKERVAYCRKKIRELVEK
jgi:hypothetical protein